MSEPVKRKASNNFIADIVSKKQKESENSSRLMTFDSLAKILGYLSMDDLVEIVDGNELLRPVIRYVFKENFGNPAQVTNYHGPNGNSSIKLLKFFGNEIRHLKVAYDDKYRQFDYIIDQVIVDQCHKSLQNISFVSADRYSMFKINKPFAKVTKVSFDRGNVCIPALDIGKWFPEARHLELLNLKFHNMQKDRLLGSHCPMLVRLDIENLRSKSGNLGYLEKIGDFIALNPQLKSLCISKQTNLDYLLSMVSTKAPNMPNLQLTISEHPTVGSISSHFNKLAKLKIMNVDHLKITVDEAELVIFHGINFTEQWFDLISNMKSVKTMVLYGDWKTGVSRKFVKMVKEFPELNILLCSGIFSELILELATQSKSLKVLYVPGSEDVCPDMELVRDAIETQSAIKWKLIHHGDNQPVILDGQDYHNVFEFEKE